MRSTIVFLAVLFLAVLFGSKSGSANIIAAELNYRHIIAGSYEFTLTIYHVCENPGSRVPNSYNIEINSASRGVNGTIGAQLTLLNYTSPNYPNLEPSNLNNCIDQTFCVKEYVYRGIVNLTNTTVPSTNYKASDWRFTIDICCNSNPNKFYRSNNTSPWGGRQVECGLNNLDFPSGNNSPFFNNRVPNFPGKITDTLLNYAVIGVCADRNIILDQSAREYDGDILRYSFSSVPKGKYPSNYIKGYSFSFPLPHSIPPGFSIDSITGLINFIPKEDTSVAGAAYYCVDVRVDEYRMDTILVGGIPVPKRRRIGYSIRNLYIGIEPDSTCTDKDFKMIGTTNLLKCNQTVLEIETNEYFLCNTLDEDASLILLKEKSLGTIIQLDSAKANECFNGKISKKFSVYFSTPLSSGEYIMMLQKGTDGNTILSECGLEAEELADTIDLIIDTVKPASMVTYLDPNNDKYLQLNCGQTEFWTVWKSPVLCSSIDSLGSDFLLVNNSVQPSITVPIDEVLPLTCKGGITDSVLIKLSQSFTPGYYELQLKQGVDSNTVLNSCLEESSTENVRIEVPEVSIDIGPDLSYCKDSFFYEVIGTSSKFATYKWNNGRNSNVIEVFTKGVYILEVNNGYGCKDRDTVVVTEIDCEAWIGIEKQIGGSFKVFPNPTRDQIQLVFKEKIEIGEVSIYNQNGQLMMHDSGQNSSGTSKLQLDVKGLPDGTYHINITTRGGQAITNKFVVSH